VTNFTFEPVVLATGQLEEVYSSNRRLLLAAMDQATLDVTRGVGDSGVSKSVKPSVRAGALAYFISDGYAEALEYCRVTVTNGFYPDTVTPWVAAIGTWLRGYGTCPPLYSDEQAIVWGYVEGVLDDPEPWERAIEHRKYIEKLAKRR